VGKVAKHGPARALAPESRIDHHHQRARAAPEFPGAAGQLVQQGIASRDPVPSVTDIPARLRTALEGGYELERELGAGGMATVYLARDRKHERRVAVKVLKPELAAALGTERFPREIRIVAQLQHPHIVPLHDSGEADGFLYYVMPYVEGESLRDRIRRGPLPVNEAVRILREVVDALAYAHGLGIMHRDIKPDNIMVTGRHAQVMDFGVAKAVRDAGGQQLTTVGVAVGTPMYMSPEQATGSNEVDARSDIYAIGILTFEMLTGEPPFTGPNAQAVLSSQVLDPAPDVTTRRAGIPPAVAEVVRRCLEKDPDARWQSAEEILPLLENVGTPSGGVTPTDTRPVSVTRGRRRRARGLQIGAAALALVTVLGLGWMLRGAGEAGRDRIAVLPFQDVSGADEAFVDGLHNGLIAALARIDGATVVTRAAVMPYRDNRKPDREIADELRIGAIVDAQVFRAGDRARLTVQFSNARTSQLYWAETYDVGVQDAFAAQDSVVQLISTGIGAVLSAAGKTP
jgi:eukaryotic-like serine/threonine-protein kinase